MRSDVDAIKDRVDIAELVSGHVKLEKAGASLKGRCPFHNEKTPSFFVSPARQSYYCFGCGEKGDIFTFVEKTEGLDFLGALKYLAEKAGIELEHRKSGDAAENGKVLVVLEEAARFFEEKLSENEAAKRYVSARGINAETAKAWRIGYAPAEWRALYSHLLSIGFDKEVIIRAGLAKTGGESKEPYDVFRDRIIFPLSDRNGRIIAFSGRGLSKETEPKYLNSPDTPVFTKSEVLYGLDRAKDAIRKRNFAVLVEGQMDLVHSHQAGVANTVASSGTAFTAGHLERLKGLSTRIILAFDGDPAGEKAAEKASILGLALGFEVKAAVLPAGKDPADVAFGNPEEWKDVLRKSVPAVEFFFNKVEEKEKDPRKLGKEIERKILPMIKLVGSSIEQAHFISLLSKRTGIREDIFWEDLKKSKPPEVSQDSGGKGPESPRSGLENSETPSRSRREQVEERLNEIKSWLDELAGSSKERDLLAKEKAELEGNLAATVLREELSGLSIEVLKAESAGNERLASELAAKVDEINKKLRALEENKKTL